MQALNPTTVFPCFAAPDRDTAAAIASFLERGADVRVFLDDGELGPGDNLASKARDGRAADVVLVLFSPHSLPRPWPRAQWESALVTEPAAEGVRIAFVKCADCAPPAVLKPVFDFGTQPLQSLRALKRWMRTRTATYQPPAPDTSADQPPALTPAPDFAAEVEELANAIADWPGVASAATPAVAFAFIHAFREDFDEIFHLEGEGRSLAALTGDLGAQLGLQLPFELDQNLARLREFCAARRFLLLLEDPTPPNELIFGGRCSILLMPREPGKPLTGPLAQVQHVLATAGSTMDWEEFCRHARLGRRLTHEQDRIAELYELMQQWHAAAETRGDRRVLDESAREIVWILEGWGRSREARLLEFRRATEFDQQMMLPW